MKKTYIFLIILFGVIFVFYAIHTIIEMQHYNYVKATLEPELKYSDILEEKLCKIDKIRSADKEWFKKYDDKLNFKNFFIICENKDTYVIKVIVEDDTLDVYGYEINGEFFYD